MIDRGFVFAFSHSFFDNLNTNDRKELTEVQFGSNAGKAYLMEMVWGAVRGVPHCQATFFLKWDKLPDYTMRQLSKSQNKMHKAFDNIIP